MNTVTHHELLINKPAWVEPGAVATDSQIEAAHAATEIGADDKTPDGSGIVWAVMMGLAVWAVVATAAAVWVRM